MDYNQLIFKLSEYGGLVAAIVFIARIIVKLTPTPKDDTWVQTIVDVLKHVGLQLPGSTDKGANGGNQGDMTNKTEGEKKI